MSIVRDRPNYVAARLGALRCLQQKRRGQHKLGIPTITHMFASEWALDEVESAQLAVLLRKAS